MYKPGQVVWMKDVGDHKRKDRPGVIVEVNGSYLTLVPLTTRYATQPCHVDLEFQGRGSIASCEHLTSRHVSEVGAIQGRLGNDIMRAIEHAIGYHLSEVRGKTRPRHAQHSEWMLDGHERVVIVSNDRANGALHHCTVVPMDEEHRLMWAHVSTVDKTRLSRK